MKSRSTLLGLICAIWIAPSVFAAEKTYRCEVLSDAYIKSNGELILAKKIAQEWVKHLW